ncbi:hypothetical protein WR25_10281 [Diploscapter pachys]|uniref:Uncharacterized protein n=1 Tax=Diploscapter pachys TaxID=2018661 RepID=A0A2A2M2M9_9BILA|nr:hypothetical protein WR25_10281 [Diploscapter pachys]
MLDRKRMQLRRARGRGVLDDHHIIRQLPGTARGRFDAEVRRDAGNHHRLYPAPPQLQVQVCAGERAPMVLHHDDVAVLPQPLDQRMERRRRTLGGQARLIDSATRHRIGREPDMDQHHRRARGAEAFGQRFAARHDIGGAVRPLVAGDDAVLQVDEDERGGAGIERRHGRSTGERPRRSALARHPDRRLGVAIGVRLPAERGDPHPGADDRVDHVFVRLARDTARVVGQRGQRRLHAIDPGRQQAHDPRPFRRQQHAPRGQRFVRPIGAGLRRLVRQPPWRLREHDQRRVRIDLDQPAGLRRPSESGPGRIALGECVPQ